METDRVSCVRCDNRILPETAARNNGLCGVCERKRAKLATAVTAKAAMEPDPNLEPWLEMQLCIIENRLSDDLRRHVNILVGDKIDFYGYAILAWDYGTITYDDAPSIAVAYNRESDIAEANADSVYYRYSPDEWENYVHTGFDKTNAALQTLYADFLGQFYKDPDDRICNNNRGAFFDRVHCTYLKSLEQTRADGTFPPSVFLVIWISDSSYEIMDDSARVLNSLDVYTVYSSEFGDHGG